MFHCEDDWIFTRSGFIEESMAILKERKDIITVWLRAHNDTNHHPIIKGEPYSMMDRNYIWHGFTWNPSQDGCGIIMPSAVTERTKFNRNDPSSAEKAIDNLYFRRGFQFSNFK